MNNQMMPLENKDESMLGDSVDVAQVVAVDDDIEEYSDFSYDGFQVVRREFFAHIFEPSITFNNCKVGFNTACINKLSGVEYVQFLVNPDKQLLAVRPCKEEDRDSFMWCSVKGNKRKPKQSTCKMFFAKIVSLMGWNPDYRYKLIGKVIKSNEEYLIVFDLTSTEVYKRTITEDQKVKTSRVPVFPQEWQNQFGLPFEEHRKSLQVNIFDGYAVYGFKEGTVTPQESADGVSNHGDGGSQI